MKYFVQDLNGTRYGPYDIDELNNLVKKNRIAEATILVDYETELEFQANSVLRFPKPMKISADLPPVIEKQKTDLLPFVTDKFQNNPSTSSDFKYDENGNKYKTEDYIHIQQDTNRNMNFLLLLISYVLIFFLSLAGLVVSIICLNNAKKYGGDKLPCIISLIMNALATIVGTVWQIYVLVTQFSDF